MSSVCPLISRFRIELRVIMKSNIKRPNFIGRKYSKQNIIYFGVVDQTISILKIKLEEG
jgi:hypothetical protein